MFLRRSASVLVCLLTLISAIILSSCDFDRVEVANKCSYPLEKRLNAVKAMDKDELDKAVISACGMEVKEAALARIPKYRLPSLLRDGDNLICTGLAHKILFRIGDPEVALNFVKRYSKARCVGKTYRDYPKDLENIIKTFPFDNSKLLEIYRADKDLAKIILDTTDSEELLAQIAALKRDHGWPNPDDAQARLKSPEAIIKAYMKRSEPKFEARYQAGKILDKISDHEFMQKVVVEAQESSWLIQDLLKRLDSKAIWQVAVKARSQDVRKLAKSELCLNIPTMSDQQAFELIKLTEECLKSIFEKFKDKPEMLRAFVPICSNKKICIEAVQHLADLDIRRIKQQADAAENFDERLALMKRVPSRQWYIVFKSIQLEPAVMDYYGELKYSESSSQVNEHQYIVKKFQHMIKLHAHNICIEIKDSHGKTISKRIFKARLPRTEEVFKNLQDKILLPAIDWDKIHEDLLAPLDSERKTKLKKALDDNRKKYDWFYKSSVRLGDG